MNMKNKQEVLKECNDIIGDRISKLKQTIKENRNSIDQLVLL